jgi:hypothetical protein
MPDAPSVLVVVGNLLEFLEEALLPPYMYRQDHIHRQH